MPFAGPSMAKVLNRVAVDVSRDIGKVQLSAALAAKKIHQARIGADSGGDSRMSGVGKSGGKVGVRYKQQGDTVVIEATGPLHLLERPTKPHKIRPRGKKRRGVVIPGVGVRASANHPGTRGKATWAKGRAAAEPKIRKEMRQGIFHIVSKAAKP